MKTIAFKVRAILSVLVVLTVSACATTLSSSVDVRDNAQFTDLRTYAWISDQPLLTSSTQAPEVVNPLNERRIREAVEQELARKGYEKTQIAEADFVVGFNLGARDRVRYYNDFGYRYYGFYPGFGRFGYGYAGRGSYGYAGRGSNVSVTTFTEGTLVVDVFENMGKEAIWHGSASKRLFGSDATRELIDEGVAALSAEFPDRGMIGHAMEAAHINKSVVSNG